ncbi:LysR family transcriptional regulator [Chelativorans salis]|uniref:LysR family transcriptional regulator n=1 Tax=Chelativorans salis TaxID=2978478 RepID=A0ABT2LQ13_9HYPH|nr:LysR family transcriptional regulator [Chelativorans sp. EGI FJ00035]MCT7376645.1 LysR family transcriptional regulator [Chelativorans sp. EGI FJ00035]
MIVKNRVRIRQLRVFLEVARQGGVVRAAEALHLTQSAVSRTIGELERVVGLPLFDRSQRGSKLTEAGQLLQRHATSGLAQIDMGVAMAGNRSNSTDVVKAGALPTVAGATFARVVRDFKRRFPQTTVHVASGTNAELLSKLRRGDVHFVYGRLAAAEAMRGLAFEHLYSEEIAFVAAPDHALFELEHVELADLGDHSVVLHQADTIIRNEIDRFLLEHGITGFGDVVETNLIELARALVIANGFVWIVPVGVIRQDLERGDLRRLNIFAPELQGPIGISTDPAIPQSAACETLINDIRVAAKA